MSKFISYAALFILLPFIMKAAPSTPPLSPVDSVHISGTIIDGDKKPIENVEIVFGQTKILSDHEGKFRINLPAQLNKPGVIQFSLKGFEREIRSYHPSMGSLSFDIILHKPHCVACEALNNRNLPVKKGPSTRAGH